MHNMHEMVCKTRKPTLLTDRSSLSPVAGARFWVVKKTLDLTFYQKIIDMPLNNSTAHPLVSIYYIDLKRLPEASKSRTIISILILLFQNESAR